MSAEIEEDGQVAAQRRDLVMEIAALEREAPDVLPLFELECGAGFANLVAAVEVYRGWGWG